MYYSELSVSQKDFSILNYHFPSSDKAETSVFKSDRLRLHSSNVFQTKLADGWNKKVNSFELFQQSVSGWELPVTIFFIIIMLLQSSACSFYTPASLFLSWGPVECFGYYYFFLLVASFKDLSKW